MDVKPEGSQPTPHMTKSIINKLVRQQRKWWYFTVDSHSIKRTISHLFYTLRVIAQFKTGVKLNRVFFPR